ncbi:aspartic peptidase domain-containing protein [Podospora australis]|uniref:Aspartic peptidase domain-containing protein n=1 Tax=Podospora australis TaxID=1536484 RepID=A0AAN6WIG2_9PEZI|nr:aspartic peptidase domain-containing protein [Podospora australis]
MIHVLLYGHPILTHGIALPDTEPNFDDLSVWPALDNTGRGGRYGGRDRGDGRRTKDPGYVRMPVSRHRFNGTGRWKWGWHWSPPPGFPQGPRPWIPSQPTTGSEQQPTTTSRSRPTRMPWFSESTNSTAASITLHRRTTDKRWGWTSLEELGGIAYIIQLDIGTPPQKVKVFVDTGSYELWVNPRCDTSASDQLCQSYGNYFPKKSNSSIHVGGNFAVTYGTGAVRGSYWSDVMSIAMFNIPSVQFAVASDSNYTFAGILGLGYTYPYSIDYPSVLNLMVSQKLISAPIFSLGLGGDQDGFSEIIFGGVNRWKFAGPLVPVPIWPPVKEQDPRWVQYWVNVTSVGMTKPGAQGILFTQKEGFTMPTLIDTGSTLSYIREDLVAMIGQQFQATIDYQGNYFVDCSYRDLPGTVDFGFVGGKMVINVRYKDFIYQQYPGRCMLGVQPADVGSTNYVLGDTFIRGAYLVFDQESDTVWMNQYYNCGDGVVTVGTTPKDPKNIVGAC